MAFDSEFAANSCSSTASWLSALGSSAFGSSAFCSVDEQPNSANAPTMANAHAAAIAMRRCFFIRSPSLVLSDSTHAVPPAPAP